MDKKFLCGFHNRTKMKGCDTQCSSCKSDQTIINLRNRIKELEDDKNRMLRQLEVNVVGQSEQLHSCNYVKRIGESCTLNNNCKYPNCE